MKKVGRTRSSHLNPSIIDGDLASTRPLRVPGATVTAWREASDSDLASLSAEPVAGATVAGSESAMVSDEDRVAGRRGRRAVLLSDGTRITFDTTRQFDTD